jgi:hypothetical protein
VLETSFIRPKYVYLSLLQLSDFVGPILAKSGGMMALVDVYCFFNRARGTGEPLGCSKKRLDHCLAVKLRESSFRSLFFVLCSMPADG